MPGPGNGVELRVAGRREGPVGLPPLTRGRGVVDRRADERVGEPHLRPEDHQSARPRPAPQPTPGCPARRPPATAGRPGPGVPAAASNSSVCVSVGSSRTRRTNRPSSWWPTGSGSGRGACPPSCSGVSSRAASTMASGLPPVSATMRSATGGSIGWVIDIASSSYAACSGRPASRRPGSACRRGSGVRRLPDSRRASRRGRPAAGGPRSRGRRPTPRPATARRRSRTAPAGPRPRPTAASARPGRPGTGRPAGRSPARRPRSAPAAAARAAGPRWAGRGRAAGGRRRSPGAVSDSTATMRTTCRSAARSTAWSSSADLPTPGLPPEDQRAAHPPADAVEDLAERLLLGARSINRTWPR